MSFSSLLCFTFPFLLTPLTLAFEQPFISGNVLELFPISAVYA